MGKVYVLRMGHRLERDKRITTHVGLTARALGADGIILSGEYDEKVIESLKDATQRWGGPFEVKYEENWKKVVKNFKGLKIQLSMYGLPFEKRIGKLKKAKKNVLLVVGGEKVPFEIFELVDYTLGIGNQPHSEVAALALVLYEMKGRKLKTKFKKAKLEIVPQERGKKVIEKFKKVFK